jgi:amidophosphoribosyltransferase
MCGIFAVTNANKAAKIAYLGLFALQHRGQESTGIATFNKNSIYFHKGMGLVSAVFQEHTLEKLKGENAIGHVRYSTSGGNFEENIQPIHTNIEGMTVSLAHNGNIVNAPHIRNILKKYGSSLQGTTDSELILHLIAQSNKNSFLEKLSESLQSLDGAFSVIILTPTHLYAAVDSLSYRPLSIGKLKNSYVIASETCAMDIVDATFIRDISAGEIVSINLTTNELQSFFFKEKVKSCSKCIFEHVYFSRPDSSVWGQLTYHTRFKMGMALASQRETNADMVIAIPDSGIPMAMGYASASNIPYKIGLVRNHYVGRTFIEPDQEARHFQVKLKFNPIKETIRDKKIILVDDSIVRGITSQKIVELLRNAGAQEIHLRVASPPIKYSCFYGIDTPKKQELLAQKMNLNEMQDYLKVNSLDFLKEDLLLKIMKNHEYCTACFNGSYQDKTSQKMSMT